MTLIIHGHVWYTSTMFADGILNAEACPVMALWDPPGYREWRYAANPDSRRLVEKLAVIRDFLSKSTERERGACDWLEPIDRPAFVGGTHWDFGPHPLDWGAGLHTDAPPIWDGYFLMKSTRIDDGLLAAYSTREILLSRTSRAAPQWARVLEEHSMGHWSNDDRVFVYTGTLAQLKQIHTALFITNGIQRGGVKIKQFVELFRKPNGDRINYLSVVNNVSKPLDRNLEKALQALKAWSDR